MKIRKTIACILCLAVFIGSAIASSSKPEETKTVGAKTEDSANEDSGNDNEDTTEATNVAADEPVTIEEQELVNQDDIIITAKEYVEDALWGDGIKINIQNNSSINISVGCSALIVNNYMITDLFSCDVAAGMQANDTIYLSSNELEAAGIDKVGQVEIYFYVYNDDTWDKLFDADVAVIETSAYDDMEVVALDDGFELYNENGIRIVGKTVDENSFWGTAVLFYVENNTDRNIGISVDNVAINGFMVSPIFSATVYSGRMAIDDMTIFSSDLEENGIESIEEVSLTFRIYDDDTYSTITESDVITFAAN